MSDTTENTESSESSQRDGVDYTQKGVMDTASYVYVLAGIPCMIIFFVVLFSLVGACDGSNTMIPA